MDNILRNRTAGKLRINKFVVRFDRSALPDPRSFYEAELGRLTRPNRKGWALGRCPFHTSKSGKSFSVNLESGGFYCFGCDARGGDVVDYVRRRDGCDFKTAAQRLGAWSDNVLTDEGRAQLAQCAQEVELRAQLKTKVKSEERAKVIALRHEIHFAVATQAEVSDRLDQLLQGAGEAYPGEVEHCWALLTLVWDDLLLAEETYMAATGLGATC